MEGTAGGDGVEGGPFGWKREGRIGSSTSSAGSSSCGPRPSPPAWKPGCGPSTGRVGGGSPSPPGGRGGPRVPDPEAPGGPGHGRGLDGRDDRRPGAGMFTSGSCGSGGVSSRTASDASCGARCASWRRWNRHSTAMPRASLPHPGGATRGGDRSGRGRRPAGGAGEEAARLQPGDRGPAGRRLLRRRPRRALGSLGGIRDGSLGIHAGGPAKHAPGSRAAEEDARQGHDPGGAGLAAATAGTAAAATPGASGKAESTASEVIGTVADVIVPVGEIAGSCLSDAACAGIDCGGLDCIPF